MHQYMIPVYQREYIQQHRKSGKKTSAGMGIFCHQVERKNASAVERSYDIYTNKTHKSE